MLAVLLFAHPRRVLPTTLALLMLALLGAMPATAADAHAEHKPAAKSEAKGEARSKGDGPAGSGHDGKSAGRADTRDPMDKLRELLAERLGAQKPPQTRSDIVRVANRSPEAHAPARSAAVPDAARLAAEHRRAKAAQAGGSHGSAASAGAHAAGDALHWGYAGPHGPEHWGGMKPEFSTCDNGQRQSPIDIRDGIKVELDPVRFDYRPSAFSVLDNGHTVQVNIEPGNAIETMGRRYELVQFHFHLPSEERINGRQFAMVAHLVHKSVDGRLAVVAVLLDRGPQGHPVVQDVWNNLPLERGEPLRAGAPLDMNALLPAERGYYTYMGSLTTPPCSEGVLWVVMKQPVPVSSQQIGIFARLYPMNARPIQSASGRLIKESN